jgi:hypothetical protein
VIRARVAAVTNQGRASGATHFATARRHATRWGLAILPFLVLSLPAGLAAATELSLRGPEIHITRTTGAIAVDGDLSDPGWRGATRVDTWYETNPGDNVPPKVRSVGYLTYDGRFIYAGFEFFDPDPSQIRAPYHDRDAISSGYDFGGIIIDPRNGVRVPRHPARHPV